ncbi:hypothetical protein GX50_05534 [[Emmonsia] crescens]|uniref:Uncharacterized protein n=1 Tax=[Emmonsia] crescens TaxID=73230 RepID=A0A2B7Z5P2_9EURO|nr:hypothetical protein GX50_05534 [Emmonsia crescens]
MASGTAAAATSPTPADLVTPTIKAEIYTTGRGGSGNMVANDDPVMARKAQDVEVEGLGVMNVEVAGESKGGGKRVFLGRGGAANVYDTSTRTDIDNANDPNNDDNHTVEKG